MIDDLICCCLCMLQQNWITNLQQRRCTIYADIFMYFKLHASQVLELAQLLHATQQQQVSSQSVASATITQLALQLKQLEQTQAEQALQASSVLQQAAPGLLEQLAELERDQQQQGNVVQQLQEAQVQQMQQHKSTDQLLQFLQQQQLILQKRLEMVVEQQQQWHTKQKLSLQQQVDQVLQKQQQLSQSQLELRQLVERKLQEQVCTFHVGNSEKAQQHTEGDGCRAIKQVSQHCVTAAEGPDTHTAQQLQQQLEEHACSITGIQELQQQLARQYQQQAQGLETLQGNMQDLTTQLASVHARHQQMQHAQQERDAAAAAAEQSQVSKQQLEEGLAAVERRLLHAVRLEAEAQQHLVELRVTANHERLKGDVAAAQMHIAKQLQQLTCDLQEAMTAMTPQQGPGQQEQQGECQLHQPAADFTTYAASSIVAARAARAHAAAAAGQSTAEPAQVCALQQEAATVSADAHRGADAQAQDQHRWAEANTKAQRDAVAVAGAVYQASSISSMRHPSGIAESKQPTSQASALPGAVDRVACINHWVSPTKKGVREDLVTASPAHRKLSDQELDVVLRLLDTMHARGSH